MKTFFKFVGYVALGLLAWFVYLMLDDEARRGIGLLIMAAWGFYMLHLIVKATVEDQFNQLKEENRGLQADLDQVKRQLSVVIRRLPER